MKTQDKLLLELIKLKSENPDLDVIFMVDSEQLCDSFSRTAHKIESVDTDYIMSSDEDYIVGTSFILDAIEDTSGDCYMAIEDAMRDMPDSIKKAILVYTGAL